ncbi:MAG: type II toxin-antitoxin system ParD family antitoxin [Planctomycetia bacterium]|nr:type II toxin-antitoxin system ParD family antitoxin [Planctomycetia bacterium]
MSTIQVELTEHFRQFVDGQIASGSFPDAGEVVRAALRLLERQTNEDQERLELLRKLCNEGIEQLDRGEGIMLHGEEELKEYLHGLGRQACERASEVGQ